jgi:GntR family transcriptional regulator
MYISLDTNCGTPLYLQLKEQMRLGIATGTLRAGEQMPTVRELASQLRINPNTVARVYRELCSEGLLSSRQGSGTFVSDQAPALADEASVELVRARLRGAIALGRSVGLSWEALREMAEEMLREAEEAGVVGRESKGETTA